MSISVSVCLSTSIISATVTTVSAVAFESTDF